MDTESVAVTLNGFEDEHDFLYGDGNFRKAVEGIRKLVKSHNNVYVNFVAYNGNIGSYERFEDFCKSIGIKGIATSPLRPVGWGRNMRNYLLSQEEFKTFFGEDADRISHPYTESVCCGKGGKDSFFVKSNGIVTACPFLMGVPLGDLYKERMPAIYERFAKRSMWAYT